jgi:hypothetical protein|tara:strand:+ start:1380 stop:1775 length:396 start_codon:yes stop_codon:yes gene_type:complete
MHKYIITRGKSRFVDFWKAEMEAIFLPIKFKNSEKQEVASNVQLVMRPVQLWELVYPEEHDAKVTNLIGNTGYDHHNFILKVKDWFVGLLGLDVVRVEPTLTEKPIPRQFVGVTILGNKKDKRDGNGNELL